MSDPMDHTRPLRLSELDLSIGQTVQIIVKGPQTRKHFTHLVGFVENEFVILRMPMENGWAVQLDEGQAVDVRMFSSVSLFEFGSRILSVQLHPRNFMLLSPPTSIQETRLRAHERVKCALPVLVTHASEGQAPWSGYQFQDLSGGGGALVGPQALGQTGDTVQLELEFRLSATGTHEHIALKAVIQSTQVIKGMNGQAASHHHGLRFDRVDPLVLLLVTELQKSRNN